MLMETASCPPASCSSVAGRPALLGAIVQPLTSVLDQLSAVLEGVSDLAYATSPAGIVSGSLGGHVRHTLDHVDAFLAGIELGALDYDRRERGTDIETSPRAAQLRIAEQRRELAALSHCSDRPVHLTVLVASQGPRVVVESTSLREAAFVLSHTIHHAALVAVLARVLGVPLPDRFGYAPATLAHLETASWER